MSGIAPGRDSSQRVNERCSVPDHLQGIDLHGLGDLAVERVDLRPQLARIERFAGDGVGLRDFARRAAGVFLHAQQERRAHAVDRRVGDRRGDDLALAGDGRSIALAYFFCSGSGK